MNATPSRRSILKGAALTAAAVAAPIRVFDAEAAAAPAADGVFGYGVASGDPLRDSVIIWTRATPPCEGDRTAAPGSGFGHPMPVRWEVARDEAFRNVVSRGVVVTSAASDHTVKVDVQGLRPYTRYFYRFHAQGETSRIGRTQTIPDDGDRLHALRFALTSCANYTGGYFAAYRAMGQRTDLDFVLQVGDYYYEQGNGDDRSGPPELVGVRDANPPTETIDLRGYRLRHALHKADPDLALAHRRHPWITIFDDHEVADNTWNDGASNHQPDTEGPFAARKRAAYQAYMEWMPFRLPDQRRIPHQGTRFFRGFSFGPLADLSIVDTRQNRAEQVGLPPYSGRGGGLVPVGLKPEVDAQLADPARQLLEPEQMAWLKDNGRTKPWHLIGNQVILSPLRIPGVLLGLPPDLTLINSDQWDGYQAQQTELISHIAAQSNNVVLLTGDFHTSMAMDIPSKPEPGYAPVGAEFVCPSVTSDGFYEMVRGKLPEGTPADAVVLATRTMTGAVTLRNPWVKMFDGVAHGWVLIDVTPDRVQADFHHTPVPNLLQHDPRIDKNATTSHAMSWQTLAGSHKVIPALTPVGPRSDEPA
ncbi:alkaline phosphatase D family protein [Kibdelosporangium phytohabitans]|uniref:Alkaline phosphatase n=1 Tax=Kibdelosporangium phytohabitans TaxID=860235 RepID=A0A0N9HUB4_9PSEU|nr:alkaline phosphatase D family protein [Kibdelosporangium phytohabitans]ALG08801.1 alkaline phosphatase [Kibdelosporangium phytohabitans]MBE1470060.1 phosphodiesterase/alkaline phosphatase D-like protein [Kibdelosporangium phytohabitans]